MDRLATYRLLLILGILAVTAACSSKRPVFYPNAHFERVGPAQANADADRCMAEAKQYGVKTGGGEKIGGRAVKGAAVGAATSAVVSAVLSGDVGRAAGAGAAGGATAGAVSGAFDANDPDQVFKNYVNRCLREKGYDVIGWQ
jgi:hypothetical protein